MIKFKFVEATEQYAHAALIGQFDLSGTNEIDLGSTRDIVARRAACFDDVLPIYETREDAVSAQTSD